MITKYTRVTLVRQGYDRSNVTEAVVYDAERGSISLWLSDAKENSVSLLTI